VYTKRKLMKDYSNGQFEQRAIVAARYEKGKFALALVRKRFSAVEVEIDPSTRRGALTLREARRLLVEYLPHEMLYRIEGYRGVLLTTKAGTNEAECTARLQAGHDREVTLLRFDGQPRGLLIGIPKEASARLVDVRPEYAALLELAVSLYVEAIGEECECYRYDPREPGVCSICFHRAVIAVDSKVVEVWQAWVTEMLDRTGSVRRKSDEVRLRLAALRQEASELEQRVCASETCLMELEASIGPCPSSGTGERVSARGRENMPEA
jgi:hypothetical protein